MKISKPLHDSRSKNDKTHFVRIFVFLAIFVLIAIVAFLFNGDVDKITGDVTSSDGAISILNISSFMVDGEMINFSRDIVSLKVNGNFNGRGYAKVFAIVDNQKILIYEFKELNGSSSLMTGFVVYGGEELQDVTQDVTSNQDVTSSEIIFDDASLENSDAVIVDANIVADASVVDAVVEDVVEDVVDVDVGVGVDGDVVNVTDVIVDVEAIVDSDIVDASVVENVSSNLVNDSTEFIEINNNSVDSELNLSSEIDVENVSFVNNSDVVINDSIFINETSNETSNEVYNELINESSTNSSNAASNISNNSSDNETIISDNICGEEICSEEIFVDNTTNSSFNVSSNLTNVIKINNSNGIVVVNGCLETCSILPTFVDSIVFEVVDGDLFVDSFNFVSLESAVVLEHDVENVSLFVGSFKLINLGDYFSGSDVFFDVSSSVGYDYELQGSSLKFIGLAEGVWPVKIYAVKNDVLITSNEFFIVVENPLALDNIPLFDDFLLNSSLNVTDNLSSNLSVIDLANVSFNVTDNSSLNESLIVNASLINESLVNLSLDNYSLPIVILPFVVDEELAQLILENSSEDVRVIIKYKDEAIDSSSVVSIQEYVDDAKENASVVISNNDLFVLQEERAIAIQELNVVDENIAQIDETLQEQDGFSLFGKDVKEKNKIKLDEDKQIQLERKDVLLDEVNVTENKIEDLAFAEKVISSSIVVEQSVLDLGVESISLVVSDIEVLKDNSDIEAVYVDSPVSSLIDDSSQIINLPEAREYAFENLDINLTGSGVKVCFVDTGLNSNVVPFSYGFDFVNNDSEPIDDSGHGTLIGYALYNLSPNVEIIAVKVLNSTSQGFESDVIAGLQYCLDQNVSVVSLSLGSGGYSGFCDNNILAQKVNELSSLGIVVVAATGNDGSSSLIKSPACASGAIAVGSSTKEDALASFTNYNDVVLLLSPGENVVTKNINGNLESISGTSISVPFISSAVALLFQDGISNFETLSFNEKKNKIVHTGDLINISFINSSGNHSRYFSRINIYNLITNNITNNLTSANIFDYNATNGMIVDALVVSCSTLSTANSVNNLTSNLSINGSTCLTVNAANITIDCQGFTIKGNNTASTSGILTTKFNTTIKNCIITDFSYGVRFNAATNGLVENVTVNVSASNSNAISFVGVSTNNRLVSSTATSASSAIYIVNSHNNTVSNSIGTSSSNHAIWMTTTAANNTLINASGMALGAYYGIVVQGVNNSVYNSTGNSSGSAGLVLVSLNNSVISGSIGESNASAGFLLSSARNNIISNCYGSSNSASAIWLLSSDNNTLSNISGNSNSATGIFVAYSNNNRIYNSSAVSGSNHAVWLQHSNNNLISYFSSITSAGIGFIGYNASNNNLTNSRLTSGDGWVSLYVWTNSNNNNFVNNTLNSTGVLLQIETTSSNNTFCWNNFTSTTGVYVNDLVGGNYYNSSLCSDEGNIYANVMDNTILIGGISNSTGFPNLYKGTFGSGYPYNNVTSAGKFSCNFAGCADYVPLTNISGLCVTNSDCITGYFCSQAGICVAKLDSAGDCVSTAVYVDNYSESNGACSSGYCRDSMPFWHPESDNDGLCDVGETCACMPNATTCWYDTSNNYFSEGEFGLQGCISNGTGTTPGNRAQCSSGVWAASSCGYSAYNQCSGTCQKGRDVNFCTDNDNTCYDSGNNLFEYLTGDGVVCSAGSEINPNSSSNCDATIDCVDRACSASTYYRGCAVGTASCTETNKQSGTAWYATINYAINKTEYKVGTSCSELYRTVETYCNTLSFFCSSDCSRSAFMYTCNGAGSCSQNFGTTGNAANVGQVCLDGAFYAGNSTLYAYNSSATPRCSSSSPSNGFGDRVYDVYACNGSAGGIGPDVGDIVLQDCGTGCCYAGTSCIATGNYGTYNWYNFGAGDGSSGVATDFCSAAVAYDCYNSGDCGSGYYCNATNNCSNACTANSVCPTGYYCSQAGVCAAKVANGDSCDYSVIYADNYTDANTACTNSYCRDEYDTAGMDGDGICEASESCWCASSSTACMTDAAEVASGAYSTNDCYSNGASTTPGQNATCSNGAWGGTSCGYSAYNQCNGVCEEGRDVMFCTNASNTCYDGGQNLFDYLEGDGKVCSGGSEVDPSDSIRCDWALNCSTSVLCSAAKYNRGCTAGTLSCTETNRQSTTPWYPSAGYTPAENQYRINGTSCSVGTNQCSGTDFCQGEIFYSGSYCDGVGNCNYTYALDKDSSQTYCESTASGCTARTWYANLGTNAGNYPQCCGDDAASDSFSTYAGTLTSSTSSSCSRCNAGTASGTNTYYGNGYYSGNLATTSSLTCYYGDITCAYNSGLDGTSATIYGNGYATASNTSATTLTCFYGDLTCADNSKANGSSADHCGNGYFSSSNILCSSATATTAESGYCYYGDIACGDGYHGNGTVSSLLYGNGYNTSSETTSLTLTCYYGDISCADGSSGSGTSTTLYGNGNATASNTTATWLTCYYGDMTCGDGTKANGSSADHCGNGYFSSSNTLCTAASNTSATSGYCYSGDIACGDGYHGNGTVSSLLYGNGNWITTTCYYGDINCNNGASGNGASATMMCSVGTTTCCNSGTYYEGLTCTDGGYTNPSYDRDTSQARCQYSSGGCSVYNWSIGGEVNATVCCGDDASENTRTRIAHASMDLSYVTNTSDDGCCIASTDCVDDSTCVDTTNVARDADSDGDNDYCLSGTWYDCNTDAQCGTGYYCSANNCVASSISVTYNGTTPDGVARQIANAVRINVSVISVGSNVVNCTLEWNSVNETMTMVGTGTSVSCYKDKTTTDGTTNTFKVYANNTVATYGNTSTRSFRENVLPSAPTHTSPTNAGRVFGNSQTISWSAGSADADGDTTTYYWRIDTDNPPASAFTCSSSTTGTSSTACSTADNTMYYWDIITSDSYENRTATTAWSFRENAKPVILGDDVSISPVNPLTTDDLNCSVTGWSDSDSDSAQYYFQWYNSSTLKYTTGPTATTWNVLAKNNLTDGSTWNCTVTPYDGYENGTYITISKTINQGCGIVSSGSHILSSDISINDSTCINITGASVVLDCAGHSIIGNNASSTYGIYSAQFNTTIRNCNISNFGTGIYISQGASAALIEDTNISITKTGDNNVNGFAVLVKASSVTGSTFSHLRLNSSGTAGEGFREYPMKNSVLRDSTIYSIDKSIYLVTGSGNTIQNMTLFSSSNGIDVNGELDSIVLNSNIVSTGAAINNFANSHRMNYTNNTLNVLGSGHGITNTGGSNVSIDCQGKSITGSNTTGYDGIYSNQVNTTVKNCNINNFQHGLYFSGDVATTTNNNASTTHTSGTGIVQVGTNGVITGNRFNSVYRAAQVSGACGGTVFTNNIVNVTGGQGAFESESVSGTNVLIANNTIMSTNSLAIFSYTGGVNFTYINNTLISTSGTLASLSLTSSGNIFCWNNFTSTSGLYVSDANGGNFYNSSVCNNEGNIYANVLNNSIAIYGMAASSGFPALKIGTTGTGFPYSNTTSGSKFSCNFANCADFAPLTNQTILQCGTLSSANTVYTMAANLTANGTNCFTITGANVTLDCGGYSIAGNNSTATYGVYSTKVNTTVKNCQINSFGGAIMFSTGSTNGSIINNTVVTYVSWDGGILVSGGRVTITGNNATDYGSAYAIRTAGTTVGTIVANNFAYAMAAGYGIYVSNAANGGQYTNNTVFANTSRGISVTNGTNVSIDCQGKSIIGTNASGTYGIFSDQLNTNITNCIIAGFENGIYLGGTSGIVDNVTARTYVNTAYSNGIQIGGSNNLIKNSVGEKYAGTDSAAINFYGSTSSNCTNCTAIASVIAAFRARNIVGGTFTNLNITATGSAYGYYLSGSAKNSQANNLIINSVTGYGVYINSGETQTNNSITGLTLSSSGTSSASSGVYLNGGNNTIIDCQGGLVKGTNSSSTYGVYSSAIYTTIKNCMMSNFSTGMLLAGAADSNISNVSITITFGAGNGILINSNAHRVNISKLSMTNGNATGINVASGQNVSIDCLGGTISGGGGAGVYGIYSGQTNTSISNCVISNYRLSVWFAGTYDSIRYSNLTYVGSGNGITCASEYCVVANNIINITGNVNIGLANSRYGLIENNVVAGGSVFYPYSGANNNLIKSNNFSGALDISVSSYNNYTQNRLTNLYTEGSSATHSNRIFNNTFTAPSTVLLDINAQSYNNTIYWNNFTGSSTYYARDLNGTNYYNTTISSIGEGNLWYNVLSGSIVIAGVTSSSFSPYYIGSQGSGYPYNNSNAGGKLSGNIIDYAPLTTRMNSAPVMNHSRISPTTAYTNGTLKGYCAANDSDGDQVYYYYRWYNGSTISESGITGSKYAQALEINVDDLADGIQTKGESWIFSCLAYDSSANSSWKNSSTLVISNTPPPQVTLTYPGNANTTFSNRTPRYTWSAVTDIDSDSLTYNIMVSTDSSFTAIIVNQNTSNTYYDQPTELAFGNYYWKVQAHDGTINGSWSSTWNFTLVTYVSVQLITANVSFNMLNITQSDDTTDDSPLPYVVKSFSNTYIDAINFKVSSSLWSSQGLNTSYWQMKTRSKSDGSFNVSGSKTTFFNVTNTTYVVRSLNYSATRNNASFDVGITIPAYEPPGDKYNSFTIDWEVAS
ncbi:MAG: right-handed parallel beta-helix repeat-containing protein [Candidatus Woesearchaeota archaeon]